MSNQQQPPAYSEQFSQMPRAVMPGQQQQTGTGTGTGTASLDRHPPTLPSRGRSPSPATLPGHGKPGNPYLESYRDPYATSPTPPISGSGSGPTPPTSTRTSLDVPVSTATIPRPPSESSTRSRSPSPMPDPEHAQQDPHYTSEFQTQKQVWSQPAMGHSEVKGAPEVKTVEGEIVQYVVLPNGVMQLPTKTPCIMYCPKDKEFVQTVIGRRSGLVTVLSAGTLLMVAWPLAWLPFVFKKTGKDYVHKCPKCGVDLAVIPRHLV